VQELVGDAKQISSTRATPREGMCNILLCVLLEKWSGCMVFVVKLAQKPELKLCLDRRKHQWWFNHERAQEKDLASIFVLFLAVIISTKKKVVRSHYDVSLMAA
jgi:hypothetical protein